MWRSPNMITNESSPYVSGHVHWMSLASLNNGWSHAMIGGCPGFKKSQHFEPHPWHGESLRLILIDEEIMAEVHSQLWEYGLGSLLFLFSCHDVQPKIHVDLDLDCLHFLCQLCCWYGHTTYNPQPLLEQWECSLTWRDLPLEEWEILPLLWGRLAQECSCLASC